MNQQIITELSIAAGIVAVGLTSYGVYRYRKNKEPEGPDFGIPVYRSHPEAVIISCFYNPTNSDYRLGAFKVFYDSIKHLNHRILECTIGDAEPQLKNIVAADSYQTVNTSSVLWHKETLLNKIIADLPRKFKYVFWIDADVVFKNPSWLTESVAQLKRVKVVQPFEYCIHLKQGQTGPDFDPSVL